MLTKEAVYDIIKANPEHKYWKLFLLSGLQKSLIAFFNPENHNEGESLSYLDVQLQHYSLIPNLKFQIELRTAEKASGSGILGPYEFTVFQQQQQQISGFGGLGSMEGFTPIGVVQQMLQAERQLSEVRMKEMFFEQDKKRFEEEKKRMLDELNEKKTTYENQVMIAGKGFLYAVDKGIEAWSGENPQLSGLVNKSNSNSNADNNNADATDEEKAATEIAQLFADSGLSLNSIQSFKILAENYIAKAKQNVETKNNKENDTNDKQQ